MSGSFKNLPRTCAALRQPLTVAVIALAALAGAAAYPRAAHADISTGLVGWWRFDEGSGSMANDSSGSGNTGALVNSPAWTAGEINRGLSFNGTNQYVSTLYQIPAQNSGTSLTWSAWMNVNSGVAAHVVILGFRNGGTWMKLTPSSFEYSNGSLIAYGIPTGSWVQVTIVKSGTNFTYYEDGAVVGTAASSASVVTSPFYMGEDPGYSSDGDFSGSLDEVRVYSRALSPADVLQLYQYQAFGGPSDEMLSPDYGIQFDSVNNGGGFSASASYAEQDTAGETGTGFSSSTNYAISAGYQQMQTVALSLVPPQSVTMSPAIGGVSGGTSNGSTTMIVTTDDQAGYLATIQASTSPALVNIASSTVAFPDYAPAGSAPDFSFSIPSNAAAFAFSSYGADADQEFLNNGAACDAGGSSTAQACWRGLSTSAVAIADRTADNQPAGTVTTLYFRASSGSGNVQPSGTYVATTTITVIPL